MIPRRFRAYVQQVRQVASLLAVGFLVFICLRSGYLRTQESLRSYESHASDFVVSFSQRIQGVRELLPKSGTLGYISDQKDTGQFFATQYLLAPWAVIDGDQADWVLINDHPPNASAPSTGYLLSENSDGSKVYDFGNGIKLIDKRPAR